METKKLIEATCPDCRGPLSAHISEGAVQDYQCLVGHRYSARALLNAHSEAQEAALWAAVVSLEETVNLVRELGPEFSAATRDRLQAQAETKLEQAGVLRRILAELEPFETP